MFINDLNDDLPSKVLKFTDNTNVSRIVKTDADKDNLQNDLTKLVKWSEQSQMLFNFGKCKCMHVGQGNVNTRIFYGRYYTRHKCTRKRTWELQLVLT